MAKLATKKTGSKPTNPVASAIEIIRDIPTWLSDVKLNVAMIAIVSFLLYANTLFHDYTQDDAIVIYDNMYTTRGISGASGILGKDTFFGFFKEEGKAALVSGGRYRPFTLLMFAVENQIFGSVRKDAQGNPMIDTAGNAILEYPKFIGHFFNIFWYMLTSILLYFTLRRLLRSKGEDVMNVVSFLATMLFVVHPIHTEAVANIKGRDEIMALLGSLAALYFSFRAYDEKKSYWHILSAVVFFIALMSKENAIMFLAIVPLAYWFFTEAEFPTIVKQTLPLVAGAAAFLFVRGAVIGWQFGGTPMELMNNPYLKFVNGEYISFDAGEKMATIIFTLGKYVQLLFAPITLTHDYYPRHIEIMSFANPLALLSLFLYIGLTYFSFKSLKTKNVAGFGVAFYLLTMLIISNLLFPIGTNMSERFMFMPSVGFCLALAYVLYNFFKNVNVLLAILTIVCGLFALKTVTRNFVWKDNFTLFLTDVETSQNSAKLQNASGGELITQSLTEKDEKKKNEMLNKAIGHLDKAIKIHPTYRNAYLLLGNAHNYLKNYDKSIAAYEGCMKLDPSYQEAKNNLGLTYRDAGKYKGEHDHDVVKAIFYLEKAYQTLPKDPEVVRLLGVANGVSGNAPKALQWFLKSVEVSPNNAHCWWDLGTAYQAMGDGAKSKEARAKAYQLDANIEENMKKPQ